MKDFINIDYLAQAFPQGEVTMQTDSKGDTINNNRLMLSVLVGNSRYSHSFKRELLIEAMADEQVQLFVIGVFKKQLGA